MKYAVIGSRGFNDYNILKTELDSYNDISVIVSGGAKGADSLAERYANENDIELVVYMPDWKLYGRGAGIVRNKQIINDADSVIAFYNGTSNGTKSSINITKKLGKELKIVNF